MIKNISDFLTEKDSRTESKDFFSLQSPRILRVELKSRYVWAKMGSMIAYNGTVGFTRESILHGGVGNLLKKVVSSEGASLMKAEGSGSLFLADEGKKVTLFNIQDNESLIVNGSNLLAFEPDIEWNINIMKKLSGMMAGGLFNVTLSGTGSVAITTHDDPLPLRVTPDCPVYTDPQATVAWSGSLTPEFKTDIQLKSLFGRGSGESIQLCFKGDGFVMVQPYEEGRTAQISGT